ncbi:MAG: hypothetical protein AAFY08_01355 [Planctomycetota bacterium]
MKAVHRDPLIEEGERNVILQNRCGNRLTVLAHTDQVELELIYKPNARRRKDFVARNFSDRDNFTSLFDHAALPDIDASMLHTFDYDPFVTRLGLTSDGGGRNVITLVNLPEHNAFALSAPAPLTLSFRPRCGFEASDGLLTDAFGDRGESIVSFVAFDSFETNRYRVLRDGRHVLQLIEDDVILIGGEEGEHHVRRTLKELRGVGLTDLIDRVESAISPVLRCGRVAINNDSDLQRVVDVNRRVAWSAMDDGGATNGALNRVYHLIWTRDGSMTATAFAQSGLPDLLRTWTPFLLDNPSVFRGPHGEARREFTQIVGTRWSKTEDDGIYYALLSLYTLVHHVGDTRSLANDTLLDLLDALNHAIEIRFDADRGLFGSNVLGEDALGDSPYHGFDVVNGTMSAPASKSSWRDELAYCYTLYQNVNMYNCLRMAQALAEASGDPVALRRVVGYEERADCLAESLTSAFINDAGEYRALLAILRDGTQRWYDFAPRSDFWEYAWAVSAGPFLPDPATCLRSARMCLNTWPQVATYGFCPWNFLARSVKEHGGSSDEYQRLMAEQVGDAIAVTKKYPMPGAVTEYAGDREGWRGLPFGAGSLNLSVCSLLVQPLPMGVSVRASTLVDRVSDFHYRGSDLDVTAEETGDVVTAVWIDGRPLASSLQLPESWLQRGRSQVRVLRGHACEMPRLYSSTARLHRLDEHGELITLAMSSPFETQLVFDEFDAIKSLAVVDAEGRSLQTRAISLADTGRTLVTAPTRGAFTVSWRVDS